ncbi:MAG: glycosyl hydrolase [Caproiciproducens sp.]|nr:glycosyl hydrolase [Caproiciproducens sp.]
MDLKKLISKMTLEEKAGLCSGADFWHTKAVKQLGIPDIMVSDGPHGLRKQDLEAEEPDVDKSIKAVCFPTGASTACSFDRALIQKVGETLGDECQAEDVAVILGPAANIKRSPLCGRNFEYFSEDPYLTGEMAANHIKGVQSRGIGTSLKHFCANNQEHRRMTVSAEVDERTLREIYLAGFESAVKQAQPWTVMCSYNRINGVYASENNYLLNEILRDEWGFQGFVMSDWGAVNERAKGVAAGLDLEMPASGGVNDAEIVKAVKNGTLNVKDLDTAVENILNIVYKYCDNKKAGAVCSWEEHHQIAREVESECMVLLKNQDDILPFHKSDKIAFIGKFADSPRYQGGGSSHINSFRITSALEAVQGVADVTYAQGYDISADVIDQQLFDEAVRTAAAAKVAVVFAGLPEYMECEGFDREHMRMPDCQSKLIEAIAKVQPNTVVVLHNGSPVEMPWINSVKGILELYLGGQAVGAATVDVLFGDKNPCGKLAETFPLKLSDNPSYLFFPGEGDLSDYREGVFVGYRYYDKKEIPVLFPFGYGLSYTNFAYSELKLSAETIHDTDSLTVTMKVKNTGARFGKEIVQLYIHDNQTKVIRPLKELKGFEKLALHPGEEKTVSFELNSRAFAYYNTQNHDWCVQSGTFEILIGQSSRDIILSVPVEVVSSMQPARKFTLTSTLGDMMAYEKARSVMNGLMQEYAPHLGVGTNNLGEAAAQMQAAMFRDMPLRSLPTFSGGFITFDMLNNILEKINNLKIQRASRYKKVDQPF